ncbi:MAG: hypothetical protein ABI412_04050 [Sphingomicrobium sp.]
MFLADVRRQSWLLIGSLIVVLAMLALVRPVSHDESQYVAATALAVHHLPYRDFALLQTPLQPLLFAPLAMLAPGWLFLSLRLVNAMLGVITALLLFVSMRRAGAPRNHSAAATVLFLSCGATLFTVAVARNDVLPMALMAGAMALLAGSTSPTRVAGAAFALGAATAAKISFAFPAAALLALALLGPANVRAAVPWRYVVLGFLPPFILVAMLALAAPNAFLFEVITFPAKAPAEWYQRTGKGFKLGFGHPVEFLKLLATGPALAALVTVGVAGWRCREAHAKNVNAWLFGSFATAGLIAAYLPNPSNQQYLASLLVPLFACLGLTVADHARPSPQALAAWSAFALIGVLPSVEAVAGAIHQKSFVAIDVERDAHRIGTELDEAGIGGPLAGLSAHYYVDSGRPLAPEFAAGPFAYRMVGLTTSSNDRDWHIAVRNRPGELEPSSTAAVITGKEGRNHRGIVLDDDLARSALRAGFEPVFAVGDLKVWLRHADADAWARVNPRERQWHDRLKRTLDRRARLTDTVLAEPPLRS